MLDSVKQNIKRLIAAYEAEKELRVKLQNALDQANAQNEACRKQITELERQIDNLKLAEAFKASGAGSPEAKKKISSLMKEIDRCISLLEG
jgi:phage shock protein A